MFETLNTNLPTLGGKRKEKKGLFQRILNAISWLFLGVFVATLILTAVSNLNLLGGYRSLIVQSGSMEPTIMTGDVIIIAKANDYLKNDVITFKDEENSVTTHRIYALSEDNQKIYETKGDANRAEDDAKVLFEQIMGKVILVIPRLGYFLFFIRSKTGLILFVGLPALLIIVDELINIKKAVRHKS